MAAGRTGCWGGELIRGNAAGDSRRGLSDGGDEVKSGTRPPMLRSKGKEKGLGRRQIGGGHRPTRESVGHWAFIRGLRGSEKTGEGRGDEETPGTST